MGHRRKPTGEQAEHAPSKMKVNPWSRLLLQCRGVTAGVLNTPEGEDPCRAVNSRVGLALVLVETLEACLAEEL